MGEHVIRHCDLCGKDAERTSFTFKLWGVELRLIVSKEPIWGNEKAYPVSFKGELCAECRDVITEQFQTMFEDLQADLKTVERPKPFVTEPDVQPRPKRRRKVRR